MSSTDNSEHFEFDKISSPLPMDMGPFHVHDAYEMYFLENGKRRYLIENSTYDIKKYDVVLIPPHIYHKTIGDAYKRKRVEFCREFLEEYFTEEATESMLSCFTEKNRVISLSKEDFEYINALLEKIRYRQPSKCYALLAEILVFLSGISTDHTLTAAELAGGLPAAISEYIRDNYKNINSIDEIAAKFHITKYYLCRLFKKNTGITIMEYINKLKIECAKQLLSSDTKKSVTDTALESGFNSPIYMSRIFKQETGMTPREYRTAATARPHLLVID